MIRLCHDRDFTTRSGSMMTRWTRAIMERHVDTATRVAEF